MSSYLDCVPVKLVVGEKCDEFATFTDGKGNTLLVVHMYNSTTINNGKKIHGICKAYKCRGGVIDLNSCFDDYLHLLTWYNIYDEDIVKDVLRRISVGVTHKYVLFQYSRYDKLRQDSIGSNLDLYKVHKTIRN